MNICINYYGQPRTLEHAKQTFDKLFATLPYTYHVLYTTWDHTDTTKYKELFPMAYVRQVSQPKEEVYHYYERKYRQQCLSHRTMSHYLLGMYLKKETINTISEYEIKNNVEFDIIITLRTDAIIDLHRSLAWCCEQAFVNKNSVLVGDRERYDVVGLGACPDMFLVASKAASLKCLSQHDNIDACSFMYDGEKTIHPETSCYLNYKYHGCNVVYVPGRCFVNQSDRHLYVQSDSYNESIYHKYRK